ncbi:hypothetical protein HK098_001612 [Nowakowskiella sp. JEL0407]|nr:hypothetical protein HK098_001612 [Nowakowskiella sp. JEL0407]
MPPNSSCCPSELMYCAEGLACALVNGKETCFSSDSTPSPQPETPKSIQTPVQITGDNNSGSGETLGTGAIIGIICGCVLVIGLVSLIFYRNRSIKTREEPLSGRPRGPSLSSVGIESGNLKLVRPPQPPKPLSHHVMEQSPTQLTPAFWMASEPPLSYQSSYLTEESEDPFTSDPFSDVHRERPDNTAAYNQIWGNNQTPKSTTQYL